MHLFSIESSQERSRKLEFNQKRKSGDGSMEAQQRMRAWNFLLGLALLPCSVVALEFVTIKRDFTAAFFESSNFI